MPQSGPNIRNIVFVEGHLAARMTLHISEGRTKASNCRRSISTHESGAIAGWDEGQAAAAATVDLPGLAA